MIPHKIYSVPIERTPGQSRERWFLEVRTKDGRWHDVGNFDTRQECVDLLSRVTTTDTSWSRA